MYYVDKITKNRRKQWRRKELRDSRDSAGNYLGLNGTRWKVTSAGI